MPGIIRAAIRRRARSVCSSVCSTPLDLDNTRAIFRNRTTTELLRSAAVFWFVGSPLMRPTQSVLLKAANSFGPGRVVGAPLLSLVKRSVFRQFCAGKDT